ncbi:MAG: oligosaccharide flippase family protein, partial [Patescibacteria group bacterium]|nr:oligosaccharide flippase family protein [Patescibacteria group bacterium]
MSLVKVSLKGAFWLGLLQFSIKLFSFIKLIIVARILNPIDFGLFGMIIIPYGLLEVATEPGINQALIQTRKNPRKYFSSIQITFLFRGLFLFLILYFFAPIISKFYNNNLTQAIRIIALAPLTRGFINPAIVLFKKNMQFKKIFFFRLLTSISESLFTIYFALKFQSMIALPLGVVVGTISATILSYLMVKIEFTAIKFKNIIELYKYGKWVTIGTLLSYINDQGDDFVVSKVLGARLLGYYQTAYKI